MNNNNNKKVYINDLEIISAAGDSLDSSYDSLKSTQFQLDYVPTINTKSQVVYSCPLAICKKLALLSQKKSFKFTDPAWRLLFLNSINLSAINNLTNDQKATTSVIIGSSRFTSALLETTIKDYYSASGSINPKISPHTTGSSLAMMLRASYDITSESLCVSSACSSSFSAISIGYNLIKSNQTENCICGGAEWPITSYVVDLLAAAKVLNINRNPSRFKLQSFAKHPQGMVPGAGSGLCFLSHEKDKNSLAQILSVVVKSESSGLVGISKNAQMLQNAINKAFIAANILPADIDLIAVHGSGTAKGDGAEIAAINSVFKDESEKPYILISKWATGHTLGASSIIQLGLSLRACKNRFVPETHYELDSQLMSYKKNSMYEKKSYNILLVSLGFGGVSAAMVIKSF